MTTYNLSELDFDLLVQKYIQDKEQSRKELKLKTISSLQRQDPVALVEAGRFYLGLHYYDYAKEWFKRAGSFPRAKLLLGELYYLDDYNVPNDYKIARHYFKQSRNATACFHLGEIYREGHGVKPNKEKASRWFLRGAISGHRQAKYRTGLFFAESATRSQRDAMNAYYWLNAAITKNDHEPGKALATLLSSLNYDLESLMQTYQPYTSIDQVLPNDLESDDDNNNNNNNNTKEVTSLMEMDHTEAQSYVDQIQHLKNMEAQLHQQQQVYIRHIKALDQENDTLKKRLHDLEALFYAIANNSVNNPQR